MDLTSLFTIAAGFISILGVMIGLFLYLGSKIDKIREDMHAESRDFHGRLISLEERYHARKAHHS